MNGRRVSISTTRILGTGRVVIDLVLKSVFSDICLYFAGGAPTTIPETKGEFEKNKNHEKRTVEILSKKNNANCKKNIVNQLQNFD